MFSNVTGFAGAIDTVFGKTRVRTTQLGFPAELTSTYDATTGYSWARLQLDLAVPGFNDPAIQPEGQYAFEVTDNQSLAVGTRVWLEPDPDCVGYDFQAPSNTGAGCGWVAGLATTDCLELTVTSVSGACSGIDTSQDIFLAWDSGSSTWRSGATDWTGTGSGGSGMAVFGKVNGVPYLTLDGEYLTPSGCDGECLLFAGGGPVLCGGTSVQCADFFVVRVCCTCCSIAGWDGDGWYCVDAGSGCPGEVVELIDSDRCDDEITICSGPYATEEDARAACPSPVVIDCSVLGTCIDTMSPPASLNVDWVSGCPAGFKTGTLVAAYVGIVGGVRYDWQVTYTSDTGCTTTLDILCETDGSGMWFQISSGMFGTCGAFLAGSQGATAIPADSVGACPPLDVYLTMEFLIPGSNAHCSNSEGVIHVYV